MTKVDFMPGYLDRMMELTNKPARELFTLLTQLDGWQSLRFVKEETDACWYRLAGVGAEAKIPNVEYRITRAQMAMIIEQDRLLAKARAGHKLTPDEIKFVELMGEKVKRLIQ